MKHDPFYRQIIDRLNGELDPDVFEECVVDLIRKHDGLFAVPIRGGSDGGMDGAIADGEGEPIPIISTISNNVSGNMKRNLERYKKKSEGGNARKCIVATSRSLTPQRQVNLTKKARELGFTLLQVVEQSGVAARLYHDSKWCKELLHLTGQPSALSVIPVTRRQLPEFELVGRTEAKDWLRNSHGDRLLVGEPGAGKTSLLYESAIDEENRALFVVSHDEGEIANAVRDQEPKIIFVDDAHTDIDFLSKLLRLRREIRGDFEILATCWHGDRDEIVQTLDTRPENVHVLKRLTQDEMADIVINSGITGNHSLVNEIVRQAAGLPGLAGTLAYFALQGRWREIYTGDALATDITTFYKNRISGDVAGLLACFALGGNSGMGKEAVSETLSMQILVLRQDLTSLAHGGIIEEVANSKDFIMVRPPALRHALIRDVFFSGAAALPESVFERLLVEAPNPKDFALELIGANSRGGNIPAPLLHSYIGSLEPRLWKERQQRLSKCPPKWKEFATVPKPVWLKYEKIHEVWEEYAWLGHNEASWVLENFNSKYSLIARPLLQHIPEQVMPRLFNEAIGDTRPLNSNSDHPFRLLEDWIMQSHPRRAESIQRRATILSATKAWISEGRDPVIGYSAMLLAVVPHFDFAENQPGIRGSIIIHSGYLKIEHLQILQDFWKEIIKCARTYPVPNWEEFIKSVASWAYPFHGNGPDENTRKMMTDFAQEMALDVAEVASDHVGVLHGLMDLMDRSYPDFEIVTDDAIDILYPIEKLENGWEERQKNWIQAADKLACEWIEREPEEVVAQLEHIELEMSKMGSSWPRLTPQLCHRLAEKTPDPLKWFYTMLSTTLPVDTVEPFLQKAIKKGMSGWEQALQSCFQSTKLQSIAVKLTLTQENVSNELRQSALDIAGQFPNEVERLLWSNQLSKTTILELFNHPDKSLVSALAMAAWQHKPADEIDNWLRPHWENAIVEYNEAVEQDLDDYWLANVFSVEPNLGVKWLGRRFEEDSFKPYKFEKSIAAVTASLNDMERERWLEKIPDSYLWRSTVTRLVGNSPSRFEKILSSPRNEIDVLAPLSRPTIDATWIEFAKLAIQHGHAAASIASYAFSDSFSWSGNLSDLYKKRYEQFEPFMDDSDEIVRRIATAGREHFFQQYESVRSREAEEEVFGRE